MKCQGKKFHEVGKKQQTRKAQCALWFCENFGLKLSSIKLQDEKGTISSLNYDQEFPPNISDLSCDDQSNLEKVMFLLDKFCVSDEVYHELTLVSEELPRSYLIKQLRSNLNKTYHLETTSGTCPGALLNVSNTINDHVEVLLLKKP